MYIFSYAVAGTAFRWLRDRNENQCIVVSGTLIVEFDLKFSSDISLVIRFFELGESGSGKTEAARISLQCVVLAGDGSTGATSIRESLTQAGTLLEAFGNAKTMKNDNASRFVSFLHTTLLRSI